MLETKNKISSFKMGKKEKLSNKMNILLDIANEIEKKIRDSERVIEKAEKMQEKENSKYVKNMYLFIQKQEECKKKTMEEVLEYCNNEFEATYQEWLTLV